MLRDILFVLWIFIPAGVANMAPVFAAHIPALKPYDKPVDFGKSFRGRRIFGDHKTWRGFAAGIIAATFVMALQQILSAQYDWADWLVEDFDYAGLPTLIVGPLFAIGALGGDAVKSFFKRQFGIRPGGTWFPFDQIDYIIGGALAVLPFIHFSLQQYVLLLLIWTALVVVSTYIGWKLNLKDQPI
jgi:CDP-2,3-bis-(O-geranylgeranyl)-sn-glycerol synthase